MSDSDHQPADEAPATPQPAAEPALVYPPREPTWKSFLNPASLIIGAAMISWTIWWTRADDPPPAPAPVVLEAVSTAPPEPMTTSAAGAAGLLDTVKGYARQLGVNESEFNQCINTQANVAVITRDLQAGQALGVTGTPTFFINNKKLVGSQPYAVLEEIINAELKGSPTSLEGYSAGIQQLAAVNPPRFAIVESAPDISTAKMEGSRNAKVIVAEFSDFQCPFCKQWNDQALGRLRTRLGEDVALAFLHFPILSIHPNAGNVGLVAECAGQQGKFWEMHDLLFARQQEWSNLSR